MSCTITAAYPQYPQKYPVKHQATVATHLISDGTCPVIPPLSLARRPGSGLIRLYRVKSAIMRNLFHCRLCDSLLMVLHMFKENRIRCDCLLFSVWFRGVFVRFLMGCFVLIFWETAKSHE